MIWNYRREELDNDFRARLFHEFATLERTGIAVLQALPILAHHSPKKFLPKINRMLSLIRGGLVMSEAGRRSGVWLPWEASLLAAAEHSGRRELFYQRLARYYASRATRGRKLKNRMMYPYAVLLIAIVLGPLPALARGDINGLAYLVRTIIPLSLIFGSQALLIASYRRWRAGAQGLPDLLNVLPYFRNQQRRDALALLSLLLSAGVAAQEACQLLQRDLAGAWLQYRLQQVQDALQQGLGLTEALRRGDLLSDPLAEQLIASGEVSGRLEETLEHVVAGLDRRLDEQLDTLAEWLPRLIYALIVGFVISRVL